MSVIITMEFDDEWAGRLAPMVTQAAYDMSGHPIVIALLDSLGIPSVDDLTIKQRAKLIIMFDLLCRLQVFEGDVAEAQARQAIIDDINANFPLGVD